VIAATERLDGSLVGRAALGTSYVCIAAEQALALRRSLPAGANAVVLDAPAAVRREIDPWGAEDSPALVLMRRIKRRFDPGGTCNPGVFVGGI
jgi:glycolate oxidase FAD binding subunit